MMNKIKMFLEQNKVILIVILELSLLINLIYILINYEKMSIYYKEYLIPIEVIIMIMIFNLYKIYYKFILVNSNSNHVFEFILNIINGGLIWFNYKCYLIMNLWVDKIPLKFNFYIVHNWNISEKIQYFKEKYPGDMANLDIENIVKDCKTLMEIDNLMITLLNQPVASIFDKFTFITEFLSSFSNYLPNSNILMGVSQLFTIINYCVTLYQQYQIYRNSTQIQHLQDEVIQRMSQEKDINTIIENVRIQEPINYLTQADIVALKVEHETLKNRVRNIETFIGDITRNF